MEKTTNAVHAAGGRIFLQLWHGGRTRHPLLNGGAQPVAPTAITNDEVHTPEGKKPYVVPRELRDAFKGVLITNIGYRAEEAVADIAAGKIDAVAFGTSYLANPDLPERLAAGTKLNSLNAATF